MFVAPVDWKDTCALVYALAVSVVGFCCTAKMALVGGDVATDGGGGAVGWVNSNKMFKTMLSGGSFSFIGFSFVAFDASFPFFHVRHVGRGA